jgi:hypothetical protein
MWDIIATGVGASIFESAIGSYSLDQPVPDARIFVRGATGGCGLNLPDPGGTNFLSQRGTAIIER